MIVKHLFSSLLDRLTGIEQEWEENAGSEDQKQKLMYQILELRKVSDEILDHWLLLEERMSEMQDRLDETAEDSLWDGKETKYKKADHISDEVAHKIFQEIQNMAEQSKKPDSNQLVAYLSEDNALSFRKGHGYYQLLMYPQAVIHFKEVVKQDPELDVARLFLAFSEMLNENFEEAERQFQFLTITAEHRLIKATASNALGVLHAAHERWEQALLSFEKASAWYPKLKDPLFNQGLVYMRLGLFERAKPIWLDLQKNDPKDWEVLLQLARCHLEQGEREEVEELLQCLSEATGDPEALFQIGQMYEEIRQFGNAALCYQILVSQDPENAAAWHGLGWNLWHAEGTARGLAYIKKAMELAPRHSDYQFSYGWILGQMNRYEEAEAVLKGIVAQEGFSPLAMAGLAQVYLAKERWEEAKACCRDLTASEEAQVRSLGHLQFGKVYITQGDYQAAQEHLEQSIQQNPDMKEGYLLLGFILYMKGEKKEALQWWEYAM